MTESEEHTARVYRGYPALDLPKPEVPYRYSIRCFCGKKWSPSIGAGFNRYAGSGNCPDCGTDYRVWVAFQRLFGGDSSAE